MTTYEDDIKELKRMLGGAGAEIMETEQFTTDFITGIHCNFLPTGHVDKNTGKVIRDFTYNCKLKKYGV